MWLEITRKLVVNGAILAVAILWVISLLRNYNNKTLIIEPFKVPQSFMQQGYSGEVLTIRLIDEVQEIQSNGSTFVKENNILIPSWDQEKYEIKSPTENTLYNVISQFGNYFIGKKRCKAYGEVVNDSGSIDYTFRIDGEKSYRYSASRCDSLLPLAEYITEYLDPISLAAYYAEQNESLKCLRLAQEMILDDEDDNDEFAFFVKGKVYMKHKATFSKAKTMFRNAIAIGTNLSPAYNNMGLVLEYEDSLDRAIEFYTLAIRNDNTYAGAYHNLGNIFQKEFNKTQKELYADSSIKYYNTAIEYNPMFSFSYISLGTVLYNLGRLSESYDIFNQVMELDPYNAASFYQFGALLFSANDSNAIFYLEETISRDPHGLYGELAQKLIQNK